MPLGPGVRYRVKTSTSGKKTRLAFRGKHVVEAKSMRDVLAANILRRKRAAKGKK